MSGWFAVKRGITAHHIFKGNPERLAVWMWLLDNAAWKDTNHDIQGHTIKVLRGSVCASERHISKECGVGYQVVRTVLKRLKTEHMINAQVTHGKNVITLCNYEKYQDPKSTANAPPNARLTQDQRNANAQKEQGNNITTVKEEAKASLSSKDDAKAKRKSDINEAVKIWNDAAKESGWPTISILSKSRESALGARLRECGSVSAWSDAVKQAQRSDMCCGANDRGWTITFDFITTPKGFNKLIDGNYDNRVGKALQPKEHIQSTMMREARHEFFKRVEQEDANLCGGGQSEPALQIATPARHAGTDRNQNGINGRNHQQDDGQPVSAILRGATNKGFGNGRG